MTHLHATCRRATLADLPALCALGREVRLFHHSVRSDVFSEPERELGDDAAMWTETIETEDCVAFVAERASCVIGFISGTLETEELGMFLPRRFCAVGLMGVEPAHRGRGVGGALMAALEDWAAAQAATEMHLNVWAFNEAAIRLYVELGFAAFSHLMVKPVGRRQR